MANEPPLSLAELGNAPTGTIIKPHRDFYSSDLDNDYYVVALKVTTFMWAVTGHGDVVNSSGLKQFARKWEKVTAISED